MKFLHTADWQLGRVFGFEGAGEGHDPSARLFEARFEAVASIAELARSEQVAAVLVAGDVLDTQGVPDHSLRRMVHAMAGFDGRWVLLPGNHDAALAESVWTRLQRLGLITPNISLALKPGAIEFVDAGFAVLAAPLTQRQTHDDLTRHFDHTETRPGLIRIGLAHGSVEGILPSDIDSPNPIAADRATQARLDYLALGDWHGTKQVDSHTWYSGTPEPERFKDNNPGNVLQVEIDAPGAMPRVTPVRTAAYDWQESTLTLRTAADVEQLQESLQGLGHRSVVRLTLTGMLDLGSRQKLRVSLADARARVHVLEVDESTLRLEPSEADLAALRLDGSVAELVDELQQMQTQPEHADRASLALKLLFDLARRKGVDA